MFWNDAGFDYDTTLNHAEHAGFRCGTCHPFPLWDFAKRRMLKVKECPLVLMDASLLAKQYMGCETKEALSTIRFIRQMLREDTPIKAGGVLAALLSESPETIRIAMQVLGVDL